MYISILLVITGDNLTAEERENLMEYACGIPTGNVYISNFKGLFFQWEFIFLLIIKRPKSLTL